jgi:undecaprenyl-diphosphatase
MSSSGERGDALAWHAVLRRWLAARELVTMALVAVVAGGLWIFVEVASAVREDSVRALDEAVLLAMRNPTDHADPLGPRWVEEFGRDLTALGGVAVVTLLTVASAGFLWMTGRRHEVGLLAAAFLGGQLLSFSLKRVFERPRPDLVPHASWVYTASFPSGHAMMSAVTYLTIGALLARVVARRREKLFVIAWALAFTVLTGVSRVYVGVHWPTDVVAGWALGASWAVGCWLVADHLARRRRRAAALPNPASEPADADAVAKDDA